MTGQTLYCPSVTGTKCLHMDDKFPDSNRGAVIQAHLGCRSILPIIKFKCSIFYPSAPLWWDMAGLTESSLI